MPNFTIANKIELANPHANLDVLYGPYNSLAEAKATVVSVLREKGLTVGVYESGAVVEYWWKAGTTDADLVLKQASVAGAMLESEYTGTGTKSVNRAVSSQYAGQANADILGRTIHETYALKQSGVTPPETARVILDDVTPTYSIVALTAENLIVENNATTGGEILASALAADKTLKISIIGNDTLLDGTSYADGVTIFAIYEASTETWTFNSILDPDVPDYSDMTVDIMLENPTVITSMGNGIIVAQFIQINKTVFIRTHSTAIGIYKCFGLYSGNAYLQIIAAGTALHTVRVKDGDVWYSQYDGANAGSLVFKEIGEQPDLSAYVPTSRTINGQSLTANLKLVESLGYAMSDPTSNITAGVKVPCAALPYNFTLTGVRAQVGTAAVGALLLTLDIKVNTVSIFTTKLTFDSGENITETAATPYVLTAPEIPVLTSDVIELSVSQAGGVSTAAKNLTLFLIGYKTI